MPILVKKFHWNQSDTKIFLSVPLNGVHPRKVDIFISPKLLKLNYSPFLFELFFYKEINESGAKCSLTENEASFEIPKMESGLWDEIEQHLDKGEMLKLKEEAINIMQNKSKQELDTKIKNKNDLHKFAIEKAIEKDSEQAEKIKNIQDAERKNALKDLVTWEECQNSSTLSFPAKVEPNLRNKPNSQNMNINYIQKSTSNKSENNDNCKKNVKQTKMSPYKNLKEKSDFYFKTINEIETRKLPELRPSNTINVSFTKRILPTPSRESTAKDEEIWMKKINEARRASGFISDDLRPEEHNPQWCKDKGDQFFKIGNYMGAINAYSHGITLSDKLPSLYSNRAATHFAMGNFNRCIEDCSTALELLTPICKSNLGSRIKCIVRRAAALTRIGMLNKGIDEMKYAIKLDPNNEDLRIDLHNMEKAWEQDPDSD